MSGAGSGHRLTTSQVIFYASPALPLATLTLPFYLLIPNFYASEIGIPLAALGTTLSLTRVWDAIIDPVLGYLCDRFHLPLGRRRGWFLVSLPITILAVFMLFVPPQDATLWHVAFWSIIFSVGYSISSLSYTAWGAELATDYNGRNRISGYREAAIVLGTLVATILPATILQLGGDTATGLLTMAIFVAVVLPLSGLLAAARVPEPVNYSQNEISFVTGLKAIWANKPFVRLIAAFALNGLANGFPVTLFFFYVKDFLGADQQTAGLLIILYFAVSFVGIPLWLKISKRISKHRTWAWAMLAACVVFFFAPFLDRGDVVLFAIICVFTGLLVGADLVLPNSIQADVIDVDTAQTGAQRSGFYFALWSMINQVAVALAVGIAFTTLDWASFDAEQSGNMSEGAAGLFTLAVLYSWAPIAAKLASVALMWNFPLDEEQQIQLREQIEKR